MVFLPDLQLIAVVYEDQPDSESSPGFLGRHLLFLDNTLWAAPKDVTGHLFGLFQSPFENADLGNDKRNTAILVGGYNSP
jgi:hypothetical protein